MIRAEVCGRNGDIANPNWSKGYLLALSSILDPTICSIILPPWAQWVWRLRDICRLLLVPANMTCNHRLGVRAEQVVIAVNFKEIRVIVGIASPETLRPNIDITRLNVPNCRLVNRQRADLGECGGADTAKVHVKSSKGPKHY